MTNVDFLHPNTMFTDKQKDNSFINKPLLKLLEKDEMFKASLRWEQ